MLRALARRSSESWNPILDSSASTVFQESKIQVDSRMRGNDVQGEKLDSSLRWNDEHRGHAP
jgi:hypothetical protein